MPRKQLRRTDLSSAPGFAQEMLKAGVMDGGYGDYPYSDATDQAAAILGVAISGDSWSEVNIATERYSMRASLYRGSPELAITRDCCIDLIAAIDTLWNTYERYCANILQTSELLCEAAVEEHAFALHRDARSTLKGCLYRSKQAQVRISGAGWTRWIHSLRRSGKWD
jgi:hypothetical protein